MGAAGRGREVGEGDGGGRRGGGRVRHETERGRVSLRDCVLVKRFGYVGGGTRRKGGRSCRFVVFAVHVLHRIASSDGSRRARFSNGAGRVALAEIMHVKRGWRGCAWTCVAASHRSGDIVGCSLGRKVNLVATPSKDVAGAKGNCVRSDIWGGREQLSGSVCRRLSSVVCVVAYLDHGVV